MARHNASRPDESLLQINVPCGVAHETCDEIQPEEMMLSRERAEQDTVLAVGDSRLKSAAEQAQEFLQAGDADRHVDEGAVVIFPEGAEMTC